MWNSYKSLKLFIIALILIPINCYWLVQLEIVRYHPVHLNVPLSTVIFILLILTGFNGLLQKLFPALSLNQAELLIIYIILSLATTLGSTALVGIITPLVGHAFWFATPENEWQDLFWRYIPRWLTVDDKGILSGYYKGNSSLYTAEHLQAWVPPMLRWVFLIFIVGFTMLCINTIIRRQWSEGERLTYPITILPIELTESKLVFFRNRLMWIGFSISALISLINGLSYLYPFIPFIPVTRRFYSFPERPLSVIGSDGLEPASTTIALYPFTIGIGFFIPLEILSSTLFFFAFYRSQAALAALMGYRDLWTYQSTQVFGSLVGLWVLLIWIGRKHLAAVVRTALGKDKGLDDSDEPMGYRTAVFGAIFGFVILISLLYKAGMSLWLIPIFLFCYFLVPFMMTRIRSEGGIYIHNYNAQAPRHMVRQFFGNRRLGPQNLAILTISFFNHRGPQMPHQLEAFQIGKRAHINRRPLILSICFAIVIGALAAFWVELTMYYRFGAESGYFDTWAMSTAGSYFSWLQDGMVHATTQDNNAISFAGIGFFSLIFVAAMRARFIWWPFHPLGLIMAGNDEMEDHWLPLFICWVLKGCILKYGGHKTYRHAVPFFLGLALGDFTLGCTWSILSVILNRDMYHFFP